MSSNGTTDNVDQNGKKYTFVCTKDKIMQERKMQCRVDGRQVAMFYHDGEIFVLDHSCYHAGGPLSLGDIEDIQGRPCVICPYHKYKITLDNGEGLYYSYDIKDLRKPPKLRSKGVKQRTHDVKVNGNDVYVALSDVTEPRDSDYYSSSAYKAAMSLLS
ncbi:Rieske domain-containing protein-like [Actinia tenebrosa]|uniref:Rieske domain-containing protein n=1 Tax=Actinia tenebrosa TaxID=6105 RepID=A0A6P8HLN0_ACTTE|nr:Rieske domain-containing protein-like [Actinia tenebrosa]